MPRLTLKALMPEGLPPKAPAVAAIAAASLAVLAVLYVIFSGPVHAVARPPEVLARLKPEKTAKSVPLVAFSDAAGNRHMLTEFDGRYVLLNLWATWCSPCVRELPALARLQAAVPKDRLTVVAVNVGRSGAAESAGFLKAHGAAGLNVWLDSNIGLMRAFRAYGLPLTVLIDPEGREVARAVGPAEWDAPEAVAYFRSLPMPPAKAAGTSRPAHAAS